MDNKEFFDTYIFGFMCADIEREINWVREKNSGGNFLCALGLLAYTEFMGTLLHEKRKPKEWGARKTFDAFFKELGKGYKEFLEKCNVYDSFRCGLAHEYFVKKDCTIYMLNSPGPMKVKGNWEWYQGGASGIVLDVDIERPLDTGIGRAPNGNYYFVVEKYYKDFRLACENLLIELEKDDRGGWLDFTFPFLGDSG